MTKQLTEWLEWQHKRLARSADVIAFVTKHADLLGDVDLQDIGIYLDINFPTREKALELIKAFPGKWNKEYQQDKINYMLEVSDGLSLRLFNAPPPPSCRVIVEKRLVPARVVEEHYEEVARIDCDLEGNEVPNANL